MQNVGLQSTGAVYWETEVRFEPSRVEQHALCTPLHTHMQGAATSSSWRRSICNCQPMGSIPLCQTAHVQWKQLENPGIDPGTSHMLSERSTIWRAVKEVCVSRTKYDGHLENLPILNNPKLCCWNEMSILKCRYCRALTPVYTHMDLWRNG